MASQSISNSLNASINCGKQIQGFKALIGVSPEVDLVLASFLSLMGYMALFGNLYAIYYFVFGLRTMGSNPRNKPLFIHLAVLDASFGVLSIIYGRMIDFGRFEIHCMVGSPYNWAFELQQFLGALFDNVPTCILNIMCAISVFRLYAILLPFSYRYVKRRTFHIIGGLCYLIPVIFALIPLYGHIAGKKIRFNFNPLVGLPGLDQRMVIDSIDNPDTRKRMSIAYPVIYRFATIFIPITVILITSVITAVKIISRQKLRTDAKLGPAITILIMSLITFTCKVPYLFLIIYDIGQTLNFIPSAKKGEEPFITYTQFYLLFPSVWIVDSVSSVANPFIYHIRSKSLFDKSQKTTQKGREDNMTKVSTFSSNTVSFKQQTSTVSINNARSHPITPSNGKTLPSQSVECDV